MNKHYSNNTLLKSEHKGDISGMPLDNRHISAIFDSIPIFLGKYCSVTEECIILHQDNLCLNHSLKSELLILRFQDSQYESQLQSAQKIEIDYHEYSETTRTFSVSGQFDDKVRYNLNNSKKIYGKKSF